MSQKAFDKQARRLHRMRFAGEKISAKVVKRWANTLIKACHTYKGKNGGPVTAKHRRQVLLAGFKIFCS